MEKRASVAMAVYNGEKYIEEQIDSILDMMEENDELIISYDKSQDRTLDIIKAYEAKDKRVKVVYDDGRSVESNFNNAVKNCIGKYIFLADQDDVWINDKINVMVDYFEMHPECIVLVANGYLTNSRLENCGEIFQEYSTSDNPFRNFIKGTYLGCQMAFCSTIKNRVWPVNVNPPLAHDLWLGVKGAKYGKVELLDRMLIKHRLHEENFSNTSKMKLIDVIKNRMFFLTKLLF